jgi:hypothetical protein
VSECPNESEYLYYDLEHPSAVLHDWAARTMYAQLVPEPGELALSLTALGLMGFMAAVAAAPESSCRLCETRLPGGFFIFGPGDGAQLSWGRLV